MNFDDFEEKLRRQPMREVPKQWREEILSAASARPDLTATKWWHEWLWPCPQAWAGLAVVWLAILALSLTGHGNSSHPSETRVAFSRQELMDLKRQQLMFATLISPAETADIPPQPALSPRSERRKTEFEV